MVESMFDIHPSKLEVHQLIEDFEAIYAELQGQLRNPLRTLKLKLFPRCEASVNGLALVVLNFKLADAPSGGMGAGML